MASKPKNRAVVVKFPEPTDKAKAEALATFSLRPSVNAAAVIAAYGEPFGEQDLGALAESLAESVGEVNGGDMKRCEAMLLTQAHALQAIFMNLARRAVKQEYLRNYETYLRLALKAQGQCRATLETLATMKNPPIVYARQANIAQGPQQVNNGMPTPSRTREIENDQSKLSGNDNELLPDTRASTLAGKVDSQLATLGEINRTKDYSG